MHLGGNMSEIKKILAAIAFSKYSQEILNYAAKLARNLDAELVVIHVINIRDVEAVSSIQSMGYTVDTHQYLSGMEEERRTQIEQMLQEAGYPGEKVRIIFKVGHPFEKLLQAVKDEKGDMVVMGTKGRSDLEHVLMGSVAEKMIRHSPIPVVSYHFQD
jgi:nucleotide-binding universal stress UspA family protein